MVSDDERREVAERLRGYPCDTLIPYRTGVHFGMGCHEAASRFWDMCERIKSAGDYDIAYSTRSVLADLIEPSDMSQSCRDTVACDLRASESGQNLDTNRDTVPKESPAVTIAPKCDRDALLALADELDGLGLTGFSSGWSSGAVNVGSFARRIREACGEVVG